jgi:hypothetical protein
MHYREVTGHGEASAHTYIYIHARSSHHICMPYLQVDYKEATGIAAASRGATLFWSNAADRKVNIVPSDRLYRTKLDFTTTVKADGQVRLCMLL